MHFLYKIVFVFLVVVGILAALGYYLAPQDELVKADAIVAISGDEGQRLTSALNLYRDGWASVLVFSGAARDPASPSNASAMRQKALEAGVDSDDIIIEEGSHNTRENAHNVGELLREQGLDSIILVTSPYHQRRAHLEFSWVNEDLTILNYSAKDEDWRRSQWWISPRGWYLTVSESTKIGLVGLQRVAAGIND